MKETLVKTFGLDLSRLSESDPEGVVKKSGMQYYFDGVTLFPLVVMRVDNPTDIEQEGLRLQSLNLSTITRQVLLKDQPAPKLYPMIRMAYKKTPILSDGMSNS